MIVGEWTPSGEAIVRLPMRGPNGDGFDIPAVIDTGFDGWLSLPARQIRRLGLPRVGDVDVELADGRVQRAALHEASVLWDGSFRTINVEEAPTDPLLGTEMLWGYELRIRYVAGGRVEIEATP